MRASLIATAFVALVPWLTACRPAVEREAEPPKPAPRLTTRATPSAPTTASAMAATTAPAAARPDPSGGSEAERAARFDAEWQWLKTRFVEARGYRPTDPNPVLGALLDWAKPGEAVTVFDRGCRGVRVLRDEDAFHGKIHRNFKLEAGTLHESVDEIQLGARLAIFDSNTDDYERNAAGDWELSGSGGLGTLREIGLELSKVTDDGAWYDDAVVTLTLGCGERLDVESACLDGKHRTCSTCEKWGLFSHASESSFGGGSVGAVKKVKSAVLVDCSAPCPSNQGPEDLQRVEAVLAGREFYMPAEQHPHPFVFRTEAACQAYRKKHAMTRADVETWRANEKVR